MFTKSSFINSDIFYFVIILLCSSISRILINRDRAIKRLFPVLGAVAGFIGVAASAFGAHVLKMGVSVEMLSIFEVGVRYRR